MNYLEISKKKNFIFTLIILGVLASLIINVFAYNTTYGRPWDTPKKSIEGGAEYLAKGYISKGQYTLYLQRFNVDPDAVHNTYTHLYMTNIQAIASESISMYKSYSNTGLLSLNLDFVIPVYDNMPDKTSLANGTITGAIGLTSEELNDSTFENAIATFPESYKYYLRKIHIDHPSWTFKPLHTGLNWNDAVAGFQKSAAIHKNQDKLLRNNPEKLVEGTTWYRASSQTTAYYLDVRNFLCDQNILMFERMNFSTSYSISAVQKVIEKSFMSGSVNGEKYSSIFYNAGKKYDINPVHLASRAYQEQGVQGGLGATGDLVEYDGKTYKGIYNYFNIGASSGAKEGIAWASGGKTYDSSTTSFDLGDVTMDGKINASDLLKMEKYIINPSVNKLTDDEFKLADINHDGKVNSSDMLKVEKNIVNKTPIE